MKTTIFGALLVAVLISAQAQPAVETPTQREARFSMPVAPTNATLNFSNGILNWRPLIAQANTTNPFSIAVTDGGTPALSATQIFSVIVRSVTMPVISLMTASNGLFIASVSGDSGPDYTVQASTNLVTWTNLFSTNPAALPFSWTDTNTAGFWHRFYRANIGP